MAWQSVDELLAISTKKGISPIRVMELIHDGKLPDIKPPCKRKIGDFVNAIKTLRALAANVPIPHYLFASRADVICVNREKGHPR